LLSTNTTLKVLTLLKQEAEVESLPMAREYLKVGAAIALVGMFDCWLQGMQIESGTGTNDWVIRSLDD
jgi:hypothetical protein